MNRIERLVREAQRTTGAKAISILFLVGVTALLASRVPIPPLNETMLQALIPASVFYTPVAAPNPPSDVGTSAAAAARDAADRVARAARPDDPPFAPF